MQKTIIVLGSDGYIGHALTLRLLKNGYKVIGCDDFRRRQFVEEMKSFSAIDIQSPQERINLFTDNFDFEFYELSLENDYEKLCSILDHNSPTTIVNLAQQPSAPYSHKSINHARITTSGNLLGTLNLLWAMKNYAAKSHLIQIGTMGEYDPANDVKIPEGLFNLKLDGREAKKVIFPRRPGSIYHATKVASTYYIDCACRWWGLRATDIMQGVVYGGRTPELEEIRSYTRLDSDEAFGTVIHRFLIQVLLEHPMTIYGEGNHKRGFLALNDAIQCLMIAIDNPAKNSRYRTWNQLDTVYSMNDIADIIIQVASDIGIKAKKTHIKSPRVEETGYHYYAPVVNILKKMGFKPTRSLEAESKFILEMLYKNRERLEDLYDVIIPNIKWK